MAEAQSGAQMTAEKDDFLSDWKATYGELFPYRDPDRMPVSDAELALGVLMCRKIDMALKTRIIEPVPHTPVMKYELEEV